MTFLNRHTDCYYSYQLLSNHLFSALHVEPGGSFKTCLPRNNKSFYAQNYAQMDFGMHAPWFP